MEYASQFGIMRQKAAEEKLSFIKVLDYYRDRLLNLHAAEPNMQPNIQQFRAEYQTWSSFWPEQPFPGVEPAPPNHPMASLFPMASSTGTPSIAGELEVTTGMHDISPLVASRQSSPGVSRPSQASFPQTSASGKTVAHKNPPKTQQQIISESVQDTRTCGACYQPGHILADCTRKIDKYGFLCGCPRCNTAKHNFDDCVGMPWGKKMKKPKLSDYWYWVVIKRLGKPPLRSRLDFRFVNEGKWAALTKLHPQTYQFAAAHRKHQIYQGIDEKMEDPSWEHPESIGSQIHPLDAPAQQASRLSYPEPPAPGSRFGQASTHAPLPLSFGAIDGATASHAAPSAKIEPQANSFCQRGFESSGSMAKGYQIHPFRQDLISNFQQPADQESNHAVPPSIPQFSGTPQMPLAPPHHGIVSTPRSMLATAQSEINDSARDVEERAIKLQYAPWDEHSENSTP